tara:strand:- start:564 stop:842 length:279 start_codon:yes stop_codon:yes gene_type:complete
MDGSYDVKVMGRELSDREVQLLYHSLKSMAIRCLRKAEDDEHLSRRAAAKTSDPEMREILKEKKSRELKSRSDEYKELFVLFKQCHTRRTGF